MAGRRLCGNSYDLRHSCATIIPFLDYILKDIQTRLGHSSSNFTADTCLHSGIGVHEQMAEALSEKLGALSPENPFFEKFQRVLEMCWKGPRFPA